MDQIITPQAAKTSPSSKMQYEVFDLGNRQIIETPEREAEMRQFMDDLGLSGQKKLIVEQDGAIIPFPRMSVTDERVWFQACPEKTMLADYDAQVIPFEILELLAMVNAKGYFAIDRALEVKSTYEMERRLKGWIEIWDRPKEQIDPLVVGVIGEQYKSTSGYENVDKRTHYLLARWGHELQPFAAIVEQAKKSWSEKRSADAKKTIARCKNDIREAEKAIESIEADALDHFGGEYVPAIY